MVIDDQNRMNHRIKCSPIESEGRAPRGPKFWQKTTVLGPRGARPSENVFGQQTLRMAPLKVSIEIIFGPKAHCRSLYNLGPGWRGSPTGRQAPPSDNA